MDDLKKVENALRALAMGVLAKYEKKKKVDNVQELVVLATYVNMKKLDEIKNDIEGVLRAFERLDSLVEVVKQLRSAVDNLQRGHLDEAVRLLKEVNAKLEEVAKRGRLFLLRRFRRTASHIRPGSIQHLSVYPPDFSIYSFKNLNSPVTWLRYLQNVYLTPTYWRGHL